MDMPVTRNLTEVFFLMRQNSSHSKNLFADSNVRSSDSELLLSRRHKSTDNLEVDDDFHAPPAWLDGFDEVKFLLSKIRMKTDELFSLNARHLLRTVLEENAAEDEMRENLAQEVTKLLLTAHRKMQTNQRTITGHANKTEKRMFENIVSALWLSLQTLIQKFKNGQNSYLNQIKQREDRSNVFFEDLNFEKTTVDSFDNFIQPSTPSATASAYATAEIDYKSDEQIDQYFSMTRADQRNLQQQQQLFIDMDNSKLIEAREQDVANIVKSIVDLNVIFRELSTMISDQGTILDRIDYNIETTQVSVGQGLQQLQKAAHYQRKNRKIYCIVILASVTLFMLLLLIATKI